MISDLLSFVWFHPLNRANRFAALSRVLRWQIASRLMPDLIALPFVEDRFLFAKRGLTGVTGNYYCGLHELNEMAFVLHMLRAGDHFVDIGANVGSYTVLASATGSKVVAIEPIPTTFRHLSFNISLNSLHDTVTVHNIGLSNEVGVLRFSEGLDTVNHVLAYDEDLASEIGRAHV